MRAVLRRASRASGRRCGSGRPRTRPRCRPFSVLSLSFDVRRSRAGARARACHRPWRPRQAAAVSATTRARAVLPADHASISSRCSPSVSVLCMTARGWPRRGRRPQLDLVLRRGPTRDRPQYDGSSRCSRAVTQFALAGRSCSRSSSPGRLVLRDLGRSEAVRDARQFAVLSGQGIVEPALRDEHRRGRPGGDRRGRPSSSRSGCSVTASSA